MKGDLEYRGYIVSRFGNEFIARPVDEEEFSPEIVAKHLSSLICRIDEMWLALDNNRKPAWIRQWLKSPHITCLYPDNIALACKVRMRKLKAAVTALIVGGLVATGASANVMDFDKDGDVSWVDAHALVNFIMTAGGRERDVRFVMDGKIYDATIRYTRDPDVDIKVIRMEPAIQMAGDSASS